MAAFGLPEGSDKEKAAKNRAIQDATKEAIQVPFRVMERSLECMEVCKAMAEFGNPASVSDAGVGAIAARSAVMGAYLNVKINSADVEDKKWMADVLTRGKEIEDKAIALEHEILELVNSKL
jgi:glutamate formiminotransferase/formiminotetrahydrofolate cyclodeaminase